MTPQATDELLRQGLASHQAGRLDDAERMYAAVLRQAPANVDALNLSGAIAHARGHFAQAAGFFDRAIAANPRVATAHYNKANTLESLADGAGAVAAYRQAIALRPDFADAYLNLGALHFAAGRFSEAVEVFKAHLANCAPDAVAYNGLAQSLLKLGAASEAEAALRKVVELMPNHAEALAALAAIAADAGRLSDAVATMRRAVAAAPDVAEYHSVLGNWEAQTGHAEASLAAHRRAESLAPRSARVLNNRGAALLQAGHLHESEQVLLAARDADPALVDAHLNLGLARDELGRTEDAIGSVETALALAPGHVQAYQALAGMLSELGSDTAAALALEAATRHAPADPLIAFTRGLAALAAGDFEAGWRLFEARFAMARDQRYAGKGVASRPEPPAYWRGEDLRDKVLLVWTEQGIGDEILFASLLPDLIARARQVIVACSQRLKPILARAFPAAEVIVRGAEGGGGSADLQIAIGSAAQFLRPALSAFPARERYLVADPAHVRARRAAYGSGPVIGLSWRSAAPRFGGRKTIALEHFEPILRTPGATFVSLQYGDCDAELRALRESLGIEIVHDTAVDALADMDGFMAQVAAMDLVISASNSTVHAAGALGVPVWAIVPSGVGSLWYWMRAGERCPWYSSLRLFRASRRQAAAWWADPMASVAAALETWMQRRGGA